MIKVQHSPNFMKNQERGVPPNQCFICGKEVKKPKHYIRVFDPDRVVTEAEAERIEVRYA